MNSPNMKQVILVMLIVVCFLVVFSSINKFAYSGVKVTATEVNNYNGSISK